MLVKKLKKVESDTTTSVASASKRSLGTTVDVEIAGIADLQFDRYVGAAVDGKATVDLAKLVYLDDENGLVLPADNLGSFFYSANYPSCVNMFWSDIKNRKNVQQSFKAQVFPGPQQIPILDNDGVQIKFANFTRNGTGKLVDKAGHFYVDETLPRVKGAVVPNPNKKRPTLRCPWRMRFELAIFELTGSDVTVELVKAYLQRGGLMIGIGTHRPMFGRFVVEKFKQRS
jgi:hypothetical protein